ncbi:heme ABC exporter ATP-binding protein CcmA [Halocynthiibacter namhaensis]|uniref:heme ABC exporter ATP-binding protein CcmA n=1 Tax=Halocynthiibacter namhaensis TaxID=1290553 RepID=UPI0009DC93E8|nr:heme ABC exporter ATP-binding protein CcmA [Halocynthiibacter namhaensis]
MSNPNDTSNDLPRGGLRVENLTCTRGGVPVLRGVSFKLSPGVAVLLRGPNGVGKTTLLRTIAGLQPPLRGSIEMNGAIAWAGHADAIKGTLSVSENLRFWASVHGVGRRGISATLDHAIESFYLGDLTTRPAQSLSAGQKRRLGLARLCVTGAEIWALDEPTVSLDADSVTLFADAVRAHCAAGGSALIATHIDPGIEAATLDLQPYSTRGDLNDAPSGGDEDDDETPLGDDVFLSEGSL